MRGRWVSKAMRHPQRQSSCRNLIAGLFVTAQSQLLCWCFCSFLTTCSSFLGIKGVCNFHHKLSFSHNLSLIWLSFCCIIKFNSVTAKPASTKTAAPASSTKQAESKKAITITFSSLKPKPKIFVGAAFFGTGKKPTSMYKKSAPKSSTRPASVQGKDKASLPQKKSEKTTQQEQQQPALVMNQQHKHPEQVSRTTMFVCLHFVGKMFFMPLLDICLSPH